MKDDYWLVTHKITAERITPQSDKWDSETWLGCIAFIVFVAWIIWLFAG